MRTHQDALDAVKNLLSDKGLLYGKTYQRVATALSVPPQYSILVRMMEKMFRVDNLLKGVKPVNQAHLREEFLDIAVYAILAAFESEPDDSKLAGMAAEINRSRDESGSGVKLMM